MKNHEGITMTERTLEIVTQEIENFYNEVEDKAFIWNKGHRKAIVSFGYGPADIKGEDWCKQMEEQDKFFKGTRAGSVTVSVEPVRGGVVRLSNELLDKIEETKASIGREGRRTLLSLHREQDAINSLRAISSERRFEENLKEGRIETCPSDANCDW